MSAPLDWGGIQRSSRCLTPACTIVGGWGTEGAFAPALKVRGSLKGLEENATRGQQGGVTTREEMGN